MVDDIFTLLEWIQHEFMLFAAFGFMLGAIDDLVIDVIWAGRHFWKRLFIYSRHEAMTALSLPRSSDHGHLAVFVPAWDEAAVIGPMLRYCLKCLPQEDVRIFVGCYPNDPASIGAVAEVAALDARITLVLGSRDGPTTKGDCLNGLWAAMERQEHAQGFRFKGIILHDAEDVVHRAEIALFDGMLDRFDLVQIPVLPLVDRRSRWVSGHYCDEFAEAHGKSLIVREYLGAAMPSAGVGCAFSRHFMSLIAERQGGRPFDADCLTEDYELGLRIGELGGRGVLVRLPDGEGGIVCTREYFPDRLDAAVRQKARWMTGIALAGWDRLGWHGTLAERWMRLRDRRALLAAVVLTCAYVALLLYAITGVARILTGKEPLAFPYYLTLILIVNGLLLVWRMAMRCGFVMRFYGWREAVRSVPRNFVANFIAIMAARRAVAQYTRMRRGSGAIWEKTAHQFPDELAASRL